MSPEQAAQLLDSLLEGEAKERAASIVQRAGGVPFFLMSFVEGVQRGTMSANGDVPLDVAQSIRSRIAALPEGGPELLRTSAAIGMRVQHDLLMAVTGQPEDRLARMLDEALRARLLVVEGEDSLRFTYDVIREVLEHDLGSASRSLVRRRLRSVIKPS